MLAEFYNHISKFEGVSQRIWGIASTTCTKNYDSQTRDKRQPTCIPAGMSKVVVGRTQGKLPKGSYMVKAMDDDNLPCSVSIEKVKKPSFGARQLRLPFELNLGEAPLTQEQQVHLINVIYHHTKVFSLFDGDLGFCDTLKHSIPMTTDKPVYLPHHQIPVQLQSEVRKCLDN